MSFDPFENRLCRDIRNTIGHDFVKAIQENDRRHFKDVCHAYQSEKINAYHRAYIRHRINCLETVFDQMAEQGVTSSDHSLMSVILWNLELYFECHEWLEMKWSAAHGEDKKALQALVLSAVMYEQLEYGRKIPAKKVAAKAILLFKQYRDYIPEPFDVNLFLLKLTGLDPVAPKFTLMVNNKKN